MVLGARCKVMRQNSALCKRGQGRRTPGRIKPAARGATRLSAWEARTSTVKTIIFCFSEGYVLVATPSSTGVAHERRGSPLPVPQERYAMSQLADKGRKGDDLAGSLISATVAAQVQLFLRHF
ncbi:unnamed protein product [Colias eurytheme]|nr:unnamed protein product [Colias eurytheme]